MLRSLISLIFDADKRPKDSSVISSPASNNTSPVFFSTILFAKNLPIISSIEILISFTPFSDNFLTDLGVTFLPASKITSPVSASTKS